MAEVCMENFDPSFASITRPGDILVSGFNFGCGSSREQAATAILAKKIPLVVAGSFGKYASSGFPPPFVLIYITLVPSLKDCCSQDAMQLYVCLIARLTSNSIFSRNSINNALMNLEVPRLVEKLRQEFATTLHTSSQQDMYEPSQNQESLDSPKPAATVLPRRKKLTHRTGWRLTWNVKKSTVTVQEGKGGSTWVQRVGALPPVRNRILRVCFLDALDKLSSD